MHVGSLGDIVFETSTSRVFTPRDLSFSRGVRYEDHAVQGMFPASEYLAPELATCRLDMVLRRDLGCDPAGDAARLEDYCLDGVVLRLIIARRNCGRWTIRKIDQTWRHMAERLAGPLNIALNLELTEYF